MIKTDNMAFKLRSGNKPSFKMMGSKSPAKQRTIVGENTSEILKDQKGKDYSLALHDTDAGINKGDTIRPGRAPRVDNYIMGGDYELEKKGDKNYEIKSPAKQKGSKKVEMPDFASTKQVKAKTGGGAAKIDSKKVKSPAKSRADRKAGKASKAAQKHAQAEDRGKSRKADRQAVKIAKHGGHAEAAGTSSGTPVMQKNEGAVFHERIAKHVMTKDGLVPNPLLEKLKDRPQAKGYTPKSQSNDGYAYQDGVRVEDKKSSAKQEKGK